MASAKAKRELRELLDKLPRFPIGLYPTPLHELPVFSKALGGPRIFIKRDDMTGLAYGGNKARKLDYFIGEAKAQGCDVFIGGGGAIQSNHARCCAAAAIKAGMEPIIVVRAGTKYYEFQGNYLLTKMLLQGKGVYLVDSKPGPGGLGSLAVMDAIAEKLRAQGRKPYVLRGSGQPAGTVGYVECALELSGQCEQMGIKPDWIFITSTGGGQGGLMIGSKFLGESYKVVGISPAPYGTDETRAKGVADLATRTCQLLGMDLLIDPQEVLNYDYGGQAYGYITPLAMEVHRLMVKTEALFLDPVYTSKGMSGLVDQIRKGKIGPKETVIFVHTGGLPLNFAYSPELVKEYGLSQESDHIIRSLEDI